MEVVGTDRDCARAPIYGPTFAGLSAIAVLWAVACAIAGVLT